MKPIEIKIHGHSQRFPQEICAKLLEVERWPEFTGYSILPGIKKAHFDVRTPEVVGSMIRVQNTDGSSHVEEIVEWDVTNRVVLRFQDFSPPLRYLASQFIETWEFQASKDGTGLTRAMSIYPKGLLGWFILKPISRLMKKAFEVNAEQLK